MVIVNKRGTDRATEKRKKRERDRHTDREEAEKWRGRNRQTK